MSEGPVLLYDSKCALCSSAVVFVLRHERPHTLRFAPLDGEFARRTLEHRPALRLTDSVMWVEPAAEGEDRVLIRSDAALRVAAYMRGPWRLAAIARIVPRAWRDWVYELVSRHRHRFRHWTNPAGIPVEQHRHRFLDVGVTLGPPPG